MDNNYTINESKIKERIYDIDSSNIKSFSLGKLIGKIIVYFTQGFSYIIFHTGKGLFLYFSTVLSLLVGSIYWGISLYKPCVLYLDMHTTLSLKRISDLLSSFFYNCSILLYTYGTDKKYFKFIVGEKKYSDIDYARMAAGIGQFEELTLQRIQERFKIKYGAAIKVKKMRSEPLKMYTLLKDSLIK